MSAPDGAAYRARLAKREAALRAAAPYRLDGDGRAFASFDELREGLQAMGLVPAYERRPNGTFAYVDAATGWTCGYIASAAQ